MITSSGAAQVATMHSRSSALDAGKLYINRWPILDGLINDAIALGKLEQLIEFVLQRVGVDIKVQTDLSALAALEARSRP